MLTSSAQLGLGLLLLTSVLADDFDLVYQATRKDAATTSLVYSYSPNTKLGDIPTWLSTMKSDGSWPDVDYTSGCAAGKLSWYFNPSCPRLLGKGDEIGLADDTDFNIWKAEEHWARVIGMAQAWTGLNPLAAAEYANSSSFFNSTQTALQYWFDNDYQIPACLQANGCALRVVSENAS